MLSGRGPARFAAQLKLRPERRPSFLGADLALRRSFADLVERDMVGGVPHFRVIAVYGDKVWVRDVQYGSDGITNLAICRKINGPLTAEAAE